MRDSLETICAHAGAIADKLTGAVTSPVYLSTTYNYEPTGEEPDGFVYTRLNNPTRSQLEQILTQLERGEDAAAFASGSAAAQACFTSLSPGDHLIVNEDVYTGVRTMLLDIFIPWGLEVTFADLTDLQNLERSIKPNTKLVWTESPTNPQLGVVDLKKLIKSCKSRQIRVAIDNTFATPYSQNPLALGADLVMHSTTKYLSGHSDVLGGALITAKQDVQWEKIRQIQQILGAVPSPFDCWLIMRGIRSFVPRMETHLKNAKAIAAFLDKHPMVEKALYPGLTSNSGYAIAKEQMRGSGAMVSILVKGGKKEAVLFIKNLKIFTNATSLGGTESLVEHRKSVEGPESPTPDSLVRMSIGLENVDDLINDLDQALNGIK
ncbi:MAG: aminotransferase class I/II-fold pyridoxal phosphate-dependent enzyme [Cyclobacteriaceae bacterium]